MHDGQRKLRKECKPVGKLALRRGIKHKRLHKKKNRGCLGMFLHCKLPVKY